MKIIEVLDRAKVNNNMNDSDLAKALGVHRSAIARYRSGCYRPKANRLRKLAELSQLDLAAVLLASVN